MAMKVAELKEELEERGEAKSAVWQQGLAEAAAAALHAAIVREHLEASLTRGVARE